MSEIVAREWEERKLDVSETPRGVHVSRVIFLPMGLCTIYVHRAITGACALLCDGIKNDNEVPNMLIARKGNVTKSSQRRPRLSIR